ncbi:MAG: hypothetical protein NTV98_01095 [Candidatus Roizmanbacteria bacterium]|nr:hypothetical protein [Candidatus Roizmanbacteria bacterium]
MTLQKKPYLIIPYLIEQPTWGGDYICEKKGWLNKAGLVGKKIGQSYELYSKSLLATTITSTTDPLFSPEIKDVAPISVFTEERPFPLIKFTQAKGNSFQLHVKPGVNDPFWHQKAESWYYFENGKISFGIKKGADMKKYRETCIQIDDTMKNLSKLVISSSLTISKAEEQAKSYIAEKNPWQFVNVHEVKSGDIVDLSGGGLHHSWEEDKEKYPLGNIVFEVQQDEMDPVSTIRSFDQGKFLKDGTVREIQVDTYFKYVDVDIERNTLKTQQHDSVLFNTPYYVLKKIIITDKQEMETKESFHHLFVKEGSATVKSKEGEVYITQGHSCFIPKGINYTIEASEKCELLQTSL